MNDLGSTLRRSKGLKKPQIDLRVCAGLHKDGSYSYRLVVNAHGKVDDVAL